MSLEDARCNGVDLVAVPHVADLELAADLASERLEAIRSPSEEDAVPAAPRELSGGGLADPRRGPGHHCRARSLHRRGRLAH